MVANEFHVKRTADQSFERVVSRFAALLFRDIELCFSKVPDTRREDEPEQPHERKDVIGESRSVRVVLSDAQIRLVVQQAVEHIRVVINADIDHLGAERRVLIRDVRVESSTWFSAVLGVDVPGAFRFATRAKSLAI